MKFLKWFGFTLGVLILVYFLGPRPTTPHYSPKLPAVPDSTAVEQYVASVESKLPLRPDNQARIIWYNDSLKNRTDYSIVYLHGFSASQKEGDPVHYSIANYYGCNLYLSRLHDHGIETDQPLLNYTAEGVWESAKQAYAIGKQLGKKVIVMGTSTGATLALKLAAEYPEIAGLILYSPNIAINDPLAWIANNPWGLQVAQLVKGKYNTSKDTSQLYSNYWYRRYRMEGVVQMQELLETSMRSATFEKIKQPVLVLYYYRDDEHQDKVVKVSAMKRMFRQLGTPEMLKKMKAVPRAGDHVIGSFIKSKDYETVINETASFLSETMKLSPAAYR
jgi:pimeloyl-ACP methyl ester carboxylesterase